MIDGVFHSFSMPMSPWPFFHSFDSKASCVIDDVCLEHKAVANALASLDKFLVTMFATGYLDLGATFSGEYLLGGTPLFSFGVRKYLPVVSAATGLTCSTIGLTSSVCYVVADSTYGWSFFSGIVLRRLCGCV
ncbi:hypothetical protein Hanom_Chr06g00541541 [Helianthus anomalus]